MTNVTTNCVILSGSARAVVAAAARRLLLGEAEQLLQQMVRDVQWDEVLVAEALQHRSRHLHAAELAVSHPSSSERLSFRSEPPFRVEDV